MQIICVYILCCTCNSGVSQSEYRTACLSGFIDWKCANCFTDEQPADIDDPGGVDEQIEMDSSTDEQTGVDDMDESVFDQVGFSKDSSTDEQTGVDDVEVVDESLSEHFEIPVEEEPSLLDSFMAEPDVDEDEIQFKIIDNATQRGRPLPVDSKGYK